MRHESKMRQHIQQRSRNKEGRLEIKLKDIIIIVIILNTTTNNNNNYSNNDENNCYDFNSGSEEDTDKCKDISEYTCSNCNTSKHFTHPSSRSSPVYTGVWHPVTGY